MPRTDSPARTTPRSDRTDQAPADDDPTDAASPSPALRRAGGTAPDAHSAKVGTKNMRVAGLISHSQALDLEFVKSMRSISSWVRDVVEPEQAT